MVLTVRRHSPMRYGVLSFVLLLPRRADGLARPREAVPTLMLFAGHAMRADVIDTPEHSPPEQLRMVGTA